MSIKEEYQIQDWILNSEPKFKYQLLDRLRQDCEYYLDYGNRSPKSLWAEDEEKQIKAMKDIWNSFLEDDKPEWLTMEQIDIYAKRMRV